jgi:hypothetical protein
MFISQDRDIPEMKNPPAICLILLLFSFAKSSQTDACSCTWRGPFLTVAKDAPLVVRGKVLRHHRGQSPTMDVLVLETLTGGLFDSGLVVKMGDGAHCRPTLAGFPPDSEWILALNGPGSKPGSGFALSHCGEYWLHVTKDEVVGSIDGTEKQVKRLSLQELKQRLLYPHFSEQFSGRLRSGELFSRPFGTRFKFFLEPTPSGWEIVIREVGSNENLSRLTPPLHSSPNPREIEGWQLSNKPSECASRPFAAEAGPKELRGFIFSPEVGKSIDGSCAHRSVTAQDIEAIQRFGRGTLIIEQYGLIPEEDGCPMIEWMTFSVQLEGGY